MEGILVACKGALLSLDPSQEWGWCVPKVFLKRKKPHNAALAFVERLGQAKLRRARDAQGRPCAQLKIEGLPRRACADILGAAFASSDIGKEIGSDRTTSSLKCSGVWPGGHTRGGLRVIACIILSRAAANTGFHRFSKPPWWGISLTPRTPLLPSRFRLPRGSLYFLVHFPLLFVLPLAEQVLCGEAPETPIDSKQSGSKVNEATFWLSAIYIGGLDTTRIHRS